MNRMPATAVSPSNPVASHVELLSTARPLQLHWASARLYSPWHETTRAVTRMSTAVWAARFVKAGTAVASHTALVVLAEDGATLKPVNSSPGPRRSAATTLGAAPKPEFCTRTSQVTVSPTPASCRIGSLNTTRSGSLTVRKAEPTAEPGAPP